MSAAFNAYESVGRNYIDGQWTVSESGETFEQRNPANLDDVTGCFQASTPGDTDAAIAAAERAFATWRRVPAPERGALLRRVLALMEERREELAAVLTRENGKTLVESRGEIASAIKEMDFQIAQGVRAHGETIPCLKEGVFAYSMRVPLGVVGVITPWNFPLNVIIRKSVPALASGNTCVLKPASLTPRTGSCVVALFDEAGFPPGVINLVTGSGRNVGDVLVTDPRVRAISFTGSTAVGKAIQTRAAATLAKTQLEMGGKNPLVVLADADLDDAADVAVTAAYACAGQWCTSTSRVLVEAPIAERFTDMLLKRVAKVTVGDGAHTDTGMGPVCGTQQMEDILGYIEQGKAEGARLLAGGHRLLDPPLDKGCFIAPTVFGDVTPAMTIAQEEIFGPVLSVMKVADFEEAVRVANDVPFGLASSIFTNDLSKAMAFVEQTDVGLTHVNLSTALKEPPLSFGGVKESGFGTPEAGTSGIEFCTEHKVAYVRYRS